MWSILAHLGGTFLSFLVPLVIYLVFKDRDPFVRRHSATALNFHITLAIAYAVSAVLILVLIGLFLIPLLWVLALVFTIMAAVAAGDGRDYQYPLSIKLVRCTEGQTPSSRRTTVSASSRPCRVSTTRRSASAGRRCTSPSAMRPGHGRAPLRLQARRCRARRRGARRAAPARRTAARR